MTGLTPIAIMGDSFGQSTAVPCGHVKCGATPVWTDHATALKLHVVA